MTAWPPIDAHAHVDVDIHPGDLTALSAVIFAATRTLDEYTRAATRTDPAAIWGVGAHPAIPAAIERYDSSAFHTSVNDAALVSEVGLDGRAPTPLAQQAAVLDDILAICADLRRIVSVHSARASKEMLHVLERHPQPGVVLHWWRGNPAETTAAVELGCWFSINQRELRGARALGIVPPERLLTETDHPFGDRGERGARPGNTAEIEAAIASRYGMTTEQVRRGLWGNLARIVDATGVGSLVPTSVQEILLAAPSALGSDA